MKITRKRAKKLLEVSEEEREKIWKENEEGRDECPFEKWERERKKILDRLRNFPDLVEETTSRLEVDRPKQGRKQKPDPAQKSMLILFARLAQKGNRDMEAILSI
ncbi:hypothetical protein AKJ66_04745 [candidate division MSBL1 archaeon SCGC-AAA259E22]|uniref:Uncharacterized protein n=1 Tax=candidate division MSBL1 archaeon SCGC-AAA259E22 TaxID=1698265 RepID=A0A133UD02_9EURY|nr:hypothetical protein AKJ66_04745 [candidate division MSBL1 archaeon SCGC-AAA259E22]